MSRDTRDHTPWSDITDYYSSCADIRAAPDVEASTASSNNYCARADCHIVTNENLVLRTDRTLGSQCHLMMKQDSVTNLDIRMYYHTQPIV